MNKLFFQINKSEPQEFLEVQTNENFTLLKVDKFPTKEELENFNHSLIVFQDKEGNQFRIFSQPIN